ncbi:testis-specific protein 10-interacting protein, partial [Erinaceus europaeus]|uniref:Testis-specific protein 10-interacting protein n=1 Tax=Erinaceus europaeus TaxID=9365 RepID=A0A1S3W598_ERIEU
LVFIQGGLGSGDGVTAGQQLRSRASGQTGKKDRRARGRKKGHGFMENAVPRRPSFPFQWAWESVTTDSRTLLHPHGPSMPGHQMLLPGPLHKAQRKAALPGPSFWRGKGPGQGQRRRQGAWEHSPVPATSSGPEPTGKCPEPGSECEEVSELEDLGAEETEGALSPQELPQFPKTDSIMEEESIVEAIEEAEDEEHEEPHRRTTGSEMKGATSGDEACQEESSYGPRLLQGPRESRAHARELQGPWNLEELQQQLEQHMDASPEKQRGKAPRTTAQAPNKGTKWHTLGDEEAAPFTSPSNRTSHKRQEATRSLLQAWERQWREERQQAELRRAREQRVQQQVARCLAAYAPRGARGPGATQRRLEELKRQERQRFAEYKAELQDIQHRVQARPYLFQQAMQTNARLTMTRRFSQVLSSLGLDEDQLLTEAGKEDTEGGSRKSRSHKSTKVKIQHSSQSPPRTEPNRYLTSSLDSDSTGEKD